MASTRLLSGQQADFPANRSRSVRCVRQCRPLAAEWASTVSVRYDRYSVWLRSYLCDRAQYVKIGQHCCSRSPECRCSAMTGMAYCCLLCTDVVTHSTASSTTSISIQRYTATTVSSPVPLTSGRGTCSTPRSRRLSSLGHPVSCSLHVDLVVRVSRRRWSTDSGQDDDSRRDAWSSPVCRQPCNYGGESLQGCNQSWTWIGFIHPWIGLDWVGLDWVQFLV